MTLNEHQPIKDETIFGSDIRVRYTVPITSPSLATLKQHPDYCMVSFETMYDFDDIISSSATAVLMRSSVESALQKIVPGPLKSKSDYVVVDYDGFAEFKNLLIEEVKVRTSGDKKATTMLLDLVGRHLDRLVPALTFEEMADSRAREWSTRWREGGGRAGGEVSARLLARVGITLRR